MRRDLLAETKQIIRQAGVGVLVPEAPEEIDDLLVRLLRVHENPPLPQQLDVRLALQQPGHANGVGGGTQTASEMVLLERDETPENTVAVVVHAQRGYGHHGAHTHRVPLEGHVQGAAPPPPCRRFRRLLLETSE